MLLNILVSCGVEFVSFEKYFESFLLQQGFFLSVIVIFCILY